MEDLDKLRNEISELNKQLSEQQKKITELQRLLNKLDKNATSFPISETYSQNLKNASKQAWSAENFIGLRLIHFIGIIVLVIGLSIGVKYAIDRQLVSEVMRISLAYAAGIVLYVLSLRSRKKYELFSAILFSGAMASLYFTTYAAYTYYAIVSFPIAFLLMMALSVYTVYEAIEYDHQEIAFLALVGAYGIPFLISKNADRPDLFFLYISFINLAVVFLCIRKLWKQVGRIATAITWILFIAWAWSHFSLKWQGLGYGFMSFFFLMFLLTGLSVKLFHKKEFTVNDCYQIIINNLALGIAGLLITGDSFARLNIAVITFALSAITALQAIIYRNMWRSEAMLIRMVSSFSFLLFVVFIAFEWTGLTVTLLWLLTAVILFAGGIITKSVQPRMASIILMGATLFKLLVFDSTTFTTIQKIISYLLLGILLLLVSFFYQKFKEQLFGDR
ncbi:MAG: DUF2339 domain-containing protein [Flavisolibacter sp.]